jgi:hypothetical protein
MDIQASITGIKYKIFTQENLPEVQWDNFDINNFASAGLLHYQSCTFALSKWVSPKRTRSYPFERVFNTLHVAKKITIIPVLKDEGLAGERDFIQWDTISLMSLLDVFVIFAYYVDAEKKGNKITKQKFDVAYIKQKIQAITEYHSSALHWNLQEIQLNLAKIADRAKKAYQHIAQKTQVVLHAPKGVDTFIEKMQQDVSIFMQFSRDKSKNAQGREEKTQQPKEYLHSETKSKITIVNYLGGKYFLTVDEAQIKRR